jgi:hypothetical protein
VEIGCVIDSILIAGLSPSLVSHRNMLEAGHRTGANVTKMEKLPHGEDNSSGYPF